MQKSWSWHCMLACFKIVTITFRVMSKSLRGRFSVICPWSASPRESLIAFLPILSSHISILVLCEGTCWFIIPYFGTAQMPSLLPPFCLPDMSQLKCHLLWHPSLTQEEISYLLPYVIFHLWHKSLFYDLIYPLLYPETPEGDGFCLAHLHSPSEHNVGHILIVEINKGLLNERRSEENMMV